MYFTCHLNTRQDGRGKHLETLCSYGCILYTIRCPWFHLPLLICTPRWSTASPYELQESALRLAISPCESPSLCHFPKGAEPVLSPQPWELPSDGKQLKVPDSQNKHPGTQSQLLMIMTCRPLCANQTPPPSLQAEARRGVAEYGPPVTSRRPMLIGGPVP